MNLDYEKIRAEAENYKKDIIAFLRRMISHPSESCEEKEVVACIREEMEKLGFDKVEVDGLGNIIGWMGEGDKIIAIDGHIDTVGIMMKLFTAEEVPIRRAEWLPRFTARSS